MAAYSSSNIQALKLTLVGDGSIGKSCLILQYLYSDFVEEYEPTKADAYRRKITLQGEEVQIDILDTAGQEDYPALRDRYLKHGDGFLLVFDLSNKDTFESLKRHRENILRVKADIVNLPIVMIGNKKDLTRLRQVTSEDANDLANRWNITYIETSAKTRENVDKAFSEIFIKIKASKASRTSQMNLNRVENSFLNIPSSATHKRTPSSSSKHYKNYSSSLTPEEEKELREHSMKQRVKKFYSNFKKKCNLF